MSVIKDMLAWPLKMKEKLDALFVVPTSKKDIDKAYYIKKIESGAWKDKIVLGIADKEQDFVTTDPVLAPGQMMIGGMGSGKSVAAKFTIYTHMACNSENTLYILVDPEKGMTDYKTAFGYKENVITAINAAEKFIPIMDMLTEEMHLRKIEFSRVGAVNIYDYEKIMRRTDPSYPGMARIMLCFEEFHALGNNKLINFQMYLDKPTMAAGQFKNLMRVSRSMGVNVTIATQRATSEDVPTSFRPGLSIIMAFRVNNPGDAAIANLPGAADILSSQRGRCVWERGQMQFPWLFDGDTNPFSDQLLAKYVKPLKAKLLGKQVADYHLATSGEGTEGFVWVKPLGQLLDAKSQFDPRNIAKRILKEVDFTFEDQGNEALIANLIAERDGIRYAVVVQSERDEFSSKASLNLEASLEQLGCTRIMAICLDGSSSSLSGVCSKTHGVLVEKDELKQFAKLVDNKAKFAPDKYKERFDQFSLTRAFQNKKNSPVAEADVANDVDDDEDDFMQVALRRRQGEPDGAPRKFRG